jgi:hypothetical protein
VVDVGRRRGQARAADLGRDVDDSWRSADHRRADDGRAHDRGTGIDGSDHDRRDRGTLDRAVDD